MHLTVLSAVLACFLGDITVGGNRPVVVKVPASYDPEVPAALIIELHAYLGSPNSDISEWDLIGLAESKGFLFAKPTGTLNAVGLYYWDATDACCANIGGGFPVDDSAYLRGVIEETVENLNVDRDRIYVVGLSNGGFMAHRLACDHADLIAAAVSNAGATWKDPARCVPPASVHVLEIHGTADNTIPFSGGELLPGAVETVERWAALNGCNLTPEAGEPIDLPGIAETTVTRYRSGCSPGGSAELWTLSGGGHGSGTGQSAGVHILDYLLAHPKRPAPVASFTAAPEKGFVPLEVAFDASASSAPEGTEIARYFWNFGNGERAEGVGVAHIYSRPGRYVVSLWVLTADQRVSPLERRTVQVLCSAGDVAPWQASDLGNPMFPGSSWKEGECISLCVGGSLLSGNSDKLHFIYQEWTGNFVSTARFEEIDGAPSAQIGLMARVGMNPGAIMAAMGIQRTSTATAFRFLSRKTARGSMTSKPGEKLVVPGWVKLQRTGNDLIGYSSPDNTTWKEVSRMSLKDSPEKLIVGVFGIGGEPTDGSSFEPLRARACPTVALDCNGNGVDDALDISAGTSEDCNGHGIPDECDISSGTSEDIDSNGIPDECLPPGGLAILGDANVDGALNISDAVAVLWYLFLAGPAKLPCGDGSATDLANVKLLDWQPDGVIDISDVGAMLTFLFLGGDPHALAPEVDQSGCVRIAGCPDRCGQ